VKEYKFELRVDLLRNIPYVLDALLEIGAGVIMISRLKGGIVMLAFGWGLVIIGTIQFIRKVKTFHLTKTELIIKRPLFPFSLAEQRFLISELKEIKFINIKGRFGGPHLNIITTETAASYRIEVSKDKIDNFEAHLLALGLHPLRKDM
jgi:hypothetical protein